MEFLQEEVVRALNELEEIQWALGEEKSDELLEAEVEDVLQRICSFKYMHQMQCFVFAKDHKSVFVYKPTLLIQFLLDCFHST